MSRALADRGLSIAQFQQDLRTLVKAWGTAGKLGVELGCSAASIDNQMKGYQPPTAPMAERLYGPGRGNRLIARGPDARPVERKWVQEELVPVGPEGETPTGSDFDDEPDDVDAGIARIPAVCGARPARETTSPQPPSEPTPSAKALAGDEQGAAADDGAAANSPDAAEPEEPEDSATADVEEFERAIKAAGEAMREERTVVPDPDFMEHEARVAAMTPAAALETVVRHYPLPGGGTAIVQASPAIDFHFDARGPFIRGNVTAVSDEIRPWSKLEDGDFVAMTRGKLAGLEAELAELDAARQALLADVAKVQAQSLEAEQKAAALRRTIEIFETPMEEVVA